MQTTKLFFFTENQGDLIQLEKKSLLDLAPYLYETF